MDTDFCLRPVFTKSLLNKLQRGDSLNLYGSKGAGRKRTLDDLRQCLKADDRLAETRLIDVDLHGLQTDYNFFLKQAANAAQATSENSVALSVNSLDQLITQVQKQTPNVLFILDNFEALLNKPGIDPRYNEHFLKNLNFLKNQSGVTLLLVTDKAYSKLMLYCESQIPVHSLLELELVQLPPLQESEIRKEIKRNHANLEYAHQTVIIDEIRNKTDVYPRLCFLMDRYEQDQETSNRPFAKKVKKWMKSYDASLVSFSVRLKRGLRFLDKYRLLLKLKEMFILAREAVKAYIEFKEKINRTSYKKTSTSSPTTNEEEPSDES